MKDDKKRFWCGDRPISTNERVKPRKGDFDKFVDIKDGLNPFWS